MDLMKEINAKYTALEAEVSKKLEKVKIDELKLIEQSEKFARNSFQCQNNKVISSHEALLRNSQLLKSLDIAKALLRSRSTYSPLEHLLHKEIQEYTNNLNDLMTTPLPNCNQLPLQ